MTVEVSSRVGHDVHVATVWAGSWSAAARRAARHVAAHVLPRTSFSRVPPWTPWRGIELDPDLFYLFHEARRLASAGRLEEALDHFDQALAKDPLNPYLRLERATVLDQLALYVDALAAYLDVVAIESWYDSGVWRRYRKLLVDAGTPPPPPAARRFRSSPNGSAALQLARYRMICSLAAGERRLSPGWRRLALRDRRRSRDG